MVHIPHTYRYQEQIHGNNPSRKKYNTGVVICSISAKKPVWRNKKIQTPPQNRQVHHIGCIWILPDALSGQPDPRRIRKISLSLQRQLQSYKEVEPPRNTRSPSYPSWCSIFTSNVTHNWAHPSESWWQDPFTSAWDYTSTLQTPKGSISKHVSCGRGTWVFIGNGAIYRIAADACTW